MGYHQAGKGKVENYSFFQRWRQRDLCWKLLRSERTIGAPFVQSEAQRKAISCIKEFHPQPQLPLHQGLPPPTPDIPASFNPMLAPSTFWELRGYENNWETLCEQTKHLLIRTLFVIQKQILISDGTAVVITHTHKREAECILKLVLSRIPNGFPLFPFMSQRKHYFPYLRPLIWSSWRTPRHFHMNSSTLSSSHLKTSQELGECLKKANTIAEENVYEKKRRAEWKRGIFLSKPNWVMLLGVRLCVPRRPNQICGANALEASTKAISNNFEERGLSCSENCVLTWGVLSSLILRLIRELVARHSVRSTLFQFGQWVRDKIGIWHF